MAYPVVSKCPVCGEDMAVTKLHCRVCDAELAGTFTLNRLNRLNADQLTFVELMVKNRGNINKVGEELAISYASARSRLDDVIRALGYEIKEEPALVSTEQRKAILEDVAQGKITAEDAVRLLRGG